MTPLPPPPPLKMERSPSPLDPWGVGDHNGTRASPARSSGSQHTIAGSDFGGRDYDIGKVENQPQPKSIRTDSSSSRKRSYEDAEADANDARIKQLDDMTPRLKRRQPRVEAAYRFVLFIFVQVDKLPLICYEFSRR